LFPPAYVREIEKLAQHFFISPSTPAQHAALAAFAPGTLDILEERRHAFADRRNALLPALREIGFQFATEPQGAFYLYADISGLADSSETLAQRLIEEAGVATTPGLDFGDNAPERHLRIAYTTDKARLREAAERIGRVLQQR
jgi:aspartate/methionine/tyrosine aminotransferase